jgi:hypothetical protein
MPTAAYPLPDGFRVKAILSLLFEDLEVSPGGSFDDSVASGSWYGVYVSDAGAPVALCASDASLSACWSSALSLLPAGMAREAAKSRQLTQPMIDNLREIMNICTRLVMSETVPHLRLDDVYRAGSLPPAAAALAASARGRIDFRIALPKYGGGQLALLSS